MLERKIRLNAVEDLREFVKAADRCEFDVDVRNNQMEIDAKSIMGMMALDLTQVLTVKYKVVDSSFEQVLDKFACAS